MDKLERNIRKLRQYDEMGAPIEAIEKLVEELLSLYEQNPVAEVPPCTNNVVNFAS